MVASTKTTPVVFDLSKVRNRIAGHVELLPTEIQDHPGQAWDHPATQAAALMGILEEIGVVDEPLVYRSTRANGAYVMIDGHLRKALDPKHKWMCTVLDLTDEEADYVLATHDPVGMMKRTNVAALDALLSEVTSANQAVQEMLTDLAAKAGLYLEPVEKPEVEFEEFDESAAQDVKMLECPACGHRWPE